MKESLFLRWHLGLGDAIICNGLVRVLATRFERIILPVKVDKIVSVFWMFSDLTNVIIVPVVGDSDMNKLAQGYHMVGLGLWSKRGLVDWSRWDQQFYEDAGVPFEARWERFHSPPSPVLPAPNGEYSFVHHQPEQGRKITRWPTMQAYQPPKPPHIFYHLAAIRGATEIHVVNSCFLSLVESVPTTAKRLVLHNYARTDCGPPTLRKAWEILE